MALPRLLLVDDSEAVLAFERAALAGHYLISTAVNGREALKKISHELPDGVLLDLSMPEMDGDDVLAILQRDEALREIPVIIVSSETGRAQACMSAGAKAFLPKPIRGPELLALTAKVLEQAARARKSGGLAVLFVVSGPHEVGLPLACVKQILHQLATTPLPVGPAYLQELIMLHGEAVCVLDLPQRFGARHTRPVADRMLVIVEIAGQQLALCVDSVREPEELTAEEFSRSSGLGGALHGQLPHALLGVARTARGLVSVIDPAVLISPPLLAELARSLQAGTPA